MNANNIKDLSNAYCNRVDYNFLKKNGYKISKDEKNNKFIATKEITEFDEPNFIEIIFGNRIEYKIWTKNKLRHRKNKPAIYYYLNGNQLISCEYYLNDINYNPNSFSSIEYYENEKIKSLFWTNEYGRYHNKNNDFSVIKYEKDGSITKTWYNDGILENPILYKPTIIKTKNNKNIDFSFFIGGFLITDKVLAWCAQNNIDPLSMTEDEGKLFLICFENTI